ncbi:MAG: hypothetical protein WC552_09510 [Candidatus Omnitrophota bacterium]
MHSYLPESGIFNGIENTFEDEIIARMDAKSALSRLAPLARTSWALYEKGYSEKEIASVAGVSQEAVSKRISLVHNVLIGNHHVGCLRNSTS